MKYIKLLRFDLQNGMIRKYILIIIPLFLSMIACVDLHNRVSIINSQGHFPRQFSTSFADYLAYIYGGMAEYDAGAHIPFVFPVRWIIVLFSILFITLNYPYNDMQSVGQQILIRTKGRSLWWLSKCGWNICCTVIFHFVIYLSTIIFCLLTQSKILGGVDVELMNVMFTTNRATQVSEIGILPFSLLLLPIAISIGINLFQMTLSLFIKPIFSFLFISLFMLSSAYYMSPFWIGNYAMPIRYNLMHTNGMLISNGIIVSILLITASIIIGLISFRYYDIINRD